MNATIFEIQRTSFVDGPGIRTTVFFKGCNLKCKWCHNPESQLLKPQIMYYKNKCTGCGKCKEVCRYDLEKCDLCGECVKHCPHEARKICGRQYGVAEIFDEIKKDKLFYETSGGGVTFSGGECMLQIDFLAQILKMCRENGINTAVDTAGDVPWEYFEKIMPYTNIFLYDIKAISEKLHIEGTGVSNKRLLSNLQRISDDGRSEIIIRVPVIPQFNDSAEEIRKIAHFIKHIRCRKTELLAYNPMAKSKYDALGMKFTEYPLLEDGKIETLQNLFEKEE